MSQIKTMSTEGIVEKRKYSAPTIKAVEFKVESGFAGSGEDESNRATTPIRLASHTTFRSPEDSHGEYMTEVNNEEEGRNWF